MSLLLLLPSLPPRWRLSRLRGQLRPHASHEPPCWVPSAGKSRRPPDGRPDTRPVAGQVTPICRGASRSPEGTMPPPAGMGFPGTHHR